MVSGGCLCEKIRISTTGDPAMHALCHCLDCRKISGSTYSNNWVVPEGNFKLESGSPKTFSKIADSGKEITSHFCPDCGTTVYRTGPSFPGLVVIKAGVMDGNEWAQQNVPKVELYAGDRVKWGTAIEDAAQMPGMP